jgi:hypothetical protein
MALREINLNLIEHKLYEWAIQAQVVSNKHNCMLLITFGFSITPSSQIRLSVFLIYKDVQQYMELYCSVVVQCECCVVLLWLHCVLIVCANFSGLEGIQCNSNLFTETYFNQLRRWLFKCWWCSSDILQLQQFIWIAYKCRKATQFWFFFL